jgi:hypothetical protein
MTIGVWFDITSDCLVAPATAGACGGVADRNGECIGFLPTPFVGTPAVGIVPVAIVPPFIVTLFSPFHEPPGRQPHPYPGKNDHVPE